MPRIPVLIEQPRKTFLKNQNNECNEYSRANHLPWPTCACVVHRWTGGHACMGVRMEEQMGANMAPLDFANILATTYTCIFVKKTPSLTFSCSVPFAHTDVFNPLVIGHHRLHMSHRAKFQQFKKIAPPTNSMRAPKRQGRNFNFFLGG